MQILRLETVHIGIPLRAPMRMAGRTIGTSETILVKLVTTAGEPGWGEANVATQLTGETSASILETIAALGERLKGADARDLRQIAGIMAEAAFGQTSACAAVDMALHDAVARRLGISVARLLGGSEQLAAPFIALVDPAKVDWLDECRDRVAEGAGLIKLKVANAPLEREIAIVRDAAAALATSASLAVDANGGWSLEEARRFCSQVADTSLLFIEQPLAPDHAYTATLSGETLIPLGADESIHTAEDIVRCRTEGRASGVSLKLVKAGGLTAVRDAAALAQGLGLALNLSGKVGETSLANAATFHVGVAIPAPQWGVSLTASYLADDVVLQPLGLTGSPAVLAGPGLGVTIDENRISDLVIEKPDDLPAARSAPRDRTRAEQAAADFVRKRLAK